MRGGVGGWLGDHVGQVAASLVQFTFAASASSFIQRDFHQDVHQAPPGSWSAIPDIIGAIIDDTSNPSGHPEYPAYIERFKPALHSEQTGRGCELLPRVKF